MDLEEFRASVAARRPPDGLPSALLVLWLDAKGDWEKAHERAQEMPGGDGARLHAYLHRKEGDLGNAAYWYRRAGERMPECSLAEEWEGLARGHLARE